MNRAEISVRVVPRSSRRYLEWQADGVLKVWVAAPPVDAAANDAVVDLLAEVLGVSRRAVSIVRGHKARSKTLRVEGLSLEECRSRISR
ncbi:MAG: DUF167 domain-containing protein [Fimbriimonadaceae bacterium]